MTEENSCASRAPPMVLLLSRRREESSVRVVFSPVKSAPPPSLAVLEEKVHPLARMEVGEEGSLGAAFTEGCVEGEERGMMG